MEARENKQRAYIRRRSTGAQQFSRHAAISSTVDALAYCLLSRPVGVASGRARSRRGRPRVPRHVDFVSREASAFNKVVPDLADSILPIFYEWI